MPELYASFRTDPESVRTEELAQAIEAWAKEHMAEDGTFDHSGHPKSGQHSRIGDGMVQRMGVTDYLSTWSGIPDRRVRSILRRESKFTSLRVADALLTAAKIPGALTDGRVHVVPNPTWDPERWSEWMASRGCVGVAA